MKVVSFNYLQRKKKTKKFIIYSTKCVFKPLVSIMGAMIVLLALNIFVSNFFANIETSLQKFVDSFVEMFR
jgi:hypothetical protein